MKVVAGLASLVFLAICGNLLPAQTPTSSSLYMMEDIAYARVERQIWRYCARGGVRISVTNMSPRTFELMLGDAFLRMRYLICEGAHDALSELHQLRDAGERQVLGYWVYAKDTHELDEDKFFAMLMGPYLSAETCQAQHRKMLDADVGTSACRAFPWQPRRDKK